MVPSPETLASSPFTLTAGIIIDSVVVKTSSTLSPGAERLSPYSLSDKNEAPLIWGAVLSKIIASPPIVSEASIPGLPAGSLKLTTKLTGPSGSSSSIALVPVQ